MFYHLLYPLHNIISAFNIFRYITFRAVMAAVTAFLISLIFGPPIIRYLQKKGIKQDISRKERPGLYPLQRNKIGTPTMGGIILLLSIAVSTLLWADWTNGYILIVLSSLIWLGLVGFLDDYLKFIRRKSAGVEWWVKLSGQVILGGVVGAILLFKFGAPPTINFPFFKDWVFNVGLLYIPFVILVIAATSNAVNLTDGLDGLAIGCVIIVALAYSGMSYVTGHFGFADYLNLPYIQSAGELSIFCAAIFGAGLGFLWFNAYPASIFMGDTGALALGGAIGVVAVLIKKEMVLLIAGGIFVIEAGSVILQQLSYKFRGKRLFIIAPLHHHFQWKGWPEPKVVVRFWIGAVVLMLLSLAVLKMR